MDQQLGLARPRSPRPQGWIRLRRVTLRFFIALVAVYIIGSAVGEWSTLHPLRYGDGPAPSKYGMAYQTVTFSNADGLTLRGWWIPGSAARTVVMIHGWTSSRAEPMSKATYLHAAGYNLLVFDLRGHGTSDGSYTTMGFAEPVDIRAAVSFALRQEPTAPVALVGYSMGGALAVEAAARDPRVVGVVDDSGYGSLVDVIGNRFAGLTRLPAALDFLMLAIQRADLHFDASSVRPASDAARLHRPLLTIIGTADTMVTPAQARRVYDAAAGPKELLMVPGAAHVAGYDRDRPTYTRTVLAFLNMAFEGRQRSPNR